MRFPHLLTAALLSSALAAGALCRAQEAEVNMPATLPPRCSVSGSTGHVPSYLNDSFPQLKGYVPALKGLKFDEHPAPEASETILDQMGAAITAIIPRVPNLMAREELSQAAMALPYMISEVNQGGVSMGGGGRGGRGMPIQAPSSPTSRDATPDELHTAMQKILGTPKNRVVLNYRIEATDDSSAGPMFRESRTNAQNQVSYAAGGGPGNPKGVGFGGIWLMFEPSTRKQFSFRYLGRQKVGKQETVVVAFAQSPERVQTPAIISMGGGSCSYLSQGVVWIDPVAFQIVRLETDLLAPLTDIHVSRLHSETDFAEVRIPARALTLWLPSKVEIDWQTPEQAGAERHRYSEYRLFGATSRLVTQID